MAIEIYHPREHPHCLIHRINDGAGDALVDDFRNGTLGDCGKPAPKGSGSPSEPSGPGAGGAKTRHLGSELLPGNKF